MRGGEIERVDATKIAVGRVTNGALDSGDAIGVGRLAQHIEKSFRFAHRREPVAPGCAAANLCIGTGGGKAHRRSVRRTTITAN
jgi:hypothetical protein